MKPVKYLRVAKGIRFFLILGVSVLTLLFFFNLYLTVFSAKPYVELEGGGRIGDEFPGYQVNARMSISIPDTISIYPSGLYNTYGSFSASSIAKVRNQNRGKLQDQIENKIISYQDKTVKISNNIHVGDVVVEVLSKNKLQNLFWGSVQQLNLIFAFLYLVLLIKLTNRYIDRKIFMPRTFKLVSLLGILLITTEVLTGIVGLINMLMLQHPQLETLSTLTDKKFNFVDLSFQFTGLASYSNIAVGIFVILLAQILKEAIAVKQESELTI